MQSLLSSSAAQTLVAYDRQALDALLREQTPLGLCEALQRGAFAAQLTPEQAKELDVYLSDWVQRALGLMPLRDALLVDQQRGARVFDLLCVIHTHGRASLPATMDVAEGRLTLELDALPTAWAMAPSLVALAAQAEQQGWALAVLGREGHYPFPDNLEELTPPAPKPIMEPFVPPTGWRRRIAILLAVSGVILLSLPLMLGAIPRQAAGLPLALITLALLVGIRAGLKGYLGAFCIWMVANLPSFRYGSELTAMLWPAVPMMIIGLLLLGFDRQVRALWVWLRG
ncbi:hypothetical protein [Candidatus Viridilinea mediisalina]|uniref:Uncharacterized protein n=1 Tax=Candidatus Viridilinea mediisalina TaxID=2024553 RepID=A0A2A6RHS9_9CHLR|nr:hypothetical protein [Candidatus Viridilinea mediisalina]PDW02428.1 hypothetical protein CJ255_13980 [Candidatus Viridilinea mediisalina]